MIIKNLLFQNIEKLFMKIFQGENKNREESGKKSILNL